MRSELSERQGTTKKTGCGGIVRSRLISKLPTLSCAFILAAVFQSEGESVDTFERSEDSARVKVA